MARLEEGDRERMKRDGGHKAELVELRREREETKHAQIRLLKSTSRRGRNLNSNE